MKNLLLGVLGLCLVAANALAEDPQWRKNYPDRYTVKRGDTLWDISNTFLQNPWLWPEIWHVNPQIANPHLIYPGDIISLIYLDGKPRLTLTAGPRDIRLSPRIKVHPLGRAIPSIPVEKISSFLSGSRVVEPDQLDNAPYVLAGGQEHLILGAGDSFYARGGDFENQEVDVYGIYRPGQKFKDPDTGEVLGFQAIEIGKSRYVNSRGEVATLVLNRTNEEVRIGDRLLPSQERRINPVFFPSAPAEQVEGVIMAVEGGVTQVGHLDIVILNRGVREGLEEGNVLAIYKRGEKIVDRFTRETIELPEEKAGLLMVFRTFEKMSYALVLTADRPLEVLDMVRNP